MAKKRVFISFDYDHDEILKTFLVGQSKLPDSPFELVDWSIQEALTGNWKEKARTRIKAADLVAVICGQNHLIELRVCLTKEMQPRPCGQAVHDQCRDQPVILRGVGRP